MRTLLLILAVAVLAAADPVSVRIQTMTFPVAHPAHGEGTRGGKPGSGWYPLADPATTQRASTVTDEQVEVIILDNGLVEAWVVPAWGGRLLRALDKTGPEPLDFFARRLTDGVWQIDDQLAWNPGGVKASFPFFEHGLHLKIPAGWRVVQRPDGSATVAMDLRFTEYRTAADVQRYGRYGDEALSLQVTLRPGSTVVEWRQRKENNNPTGRGDRLWNDTTYPVPVVKTTVLNKDRQGKDVAREVPDTAAMDKLVEFLYPCRWVVDHGPKNVHTSPHWSNLGNWGVSHFGIDAPFGFVGVFYPPEDLNRLKIHDTLARQGPSAKLYTNPGSPFCEHWGGEGWVFEYPGELIEAWRPNGFTHRFWNARGIGKAAIANEHVAVGVDGGTFRVVASHMARVMVEDETDVQVPDAAIGPATVVGGTFSGKRLIVSLDGTMVLDQTFPLDRPVPAKETPRSEERRVGKECRSRWSPYH